MLDSLRSTTQSWIAKLLLGILVLSFAVWGIADVFRNGLTGNAVLSSGNSKVSITEFRLAYDQQLRFLSQRFNQRLTREQAQMMGLSQQVLAQLTAGVVLDEEARQMNLGLSKDRLALLLAEDTAFHDIYGHFDKAQYETILHQMGMRSQDYLQNRSKIVQRQQIIEALTEGTKIPDTLLKAIALYRGETRTIDYVTLPLSNVSTMTTPSDDTLKTYFDAHKLEYKAPEYRKISYVKLDAEDIADLSSVTPQEIKEYYDKNISHYTTLEKRTVEQLNFANEDAAKEAHRHILEGTSFDNIVSAQGKTPDDVKLGTFEKNSLPDQSIADAVFTLPESSVSDVIKGSFGPVLLRVTAIMPQTIQPLTAVEAEIRKTIAVSQAVKLLPDIHNHYEDTRASGETMIDAATKLNLKSVIIAAVDKTGKGSDGKPIANIPEQARFLQASFQTDAGIDNDPLTIGSNGYLWYQVNQITPARDRTLDEVKDQVISQWKTEETKKLLTAKSDDLKKRLTDGATFEELANELHLDKHTKHGITRASNDSEFSADAITQIFSGPDSIIGVAPSSDGGQILFKVTETIQPVDVSPNSLPQNLRDTFVAQLNDDLLSQLIATLQTEFPTKVNQAALERALAY